MESHIKRYHGIVFLTCPGDLLEVGHHVVFFSPFFSFSASMSPRDAPAFLPPRLGAVEDARLLDDGDDDDVLHPDADYDGIPVITISDSSDEDLEGNDPQVLALLEPDIILEQVPPNYSLYYSVNQL